MPRILSFLLLFLLALGSVTAAGSRAAAAQQPTPEAGETAVPGAQPLPQSIFLHPIDPQNIEMSLVPVGGNEGADLCASATTLVFVNAAIGGITPNVELKTESATDPALSCMWGNPPRPNGYRTVWYKFTAITNAIVTVNTDTSNYDTVVGVFTPANEANACTTLQPVACNDDFTGFTSATTFTAVQDQTYYIVIADWSAASSGEQTLNMFLQPQPATPLWQLAGNFDPAQRTHHATVAAGGFIYAVGGQTNATGTPDRSNELVRYDPASNSWAIMAQLPGTGLTDLTAVYAAGRIFVPGGDNGTPGVFNSTHYVYTINNDFWSFHLASPPIAVGWSESVAAADESGYYLLGGATSKPLFSADTDVSDAVYFYNIQSNQWLPRPSMSTPRYGHTAVRLGDRICTVGGINNANQLMGGGECWTAPFGQNWQSIASLNIPRYGAGSAVGPDGRWYVFGGTTVNANQQHVPVATTEVYDPTNPGQGWSRLNVPYDLVDPDSVFARAYPAGEFVGNNLYAIGGNHYIPSLNQYQVVPLVQHLYVPTFRLFIPVMHKSGVVDFDDNMGAARALPLNFWYGGDFAHPADFYDFYYFDLGVVSGVSTRLHHIPDGSDYNLYVFDHNKVLWGSSTNPGNLNEEVNLTLGPGRYYVLVQRLYGLPDGSGYQVIVIR